MSIAYRIATLSKSGHSGLITKVSRSAAGHIQHPVTITPTRSSVRHGIQLMPRTTSTFTLRAYSSYAQHSLSSRTFSTTTTRNSDKGSATPIKQEEEEPIQGSAPAYKRHLVICTGVESKNWVKKPELADPYHNLLLTAVRGQEVKVNWVEDGSESLPDNAPAPLPTKGPRHDLILFPDNVRFMGVRAEAFRDLSRYLEQHPIGTLRPALEKQIQDGDTWTTELVSGSGEPVTIQLVREPSAVLVCIHGSRDCKCGERGGDMYKILKDMVQMTGLTNSVKIYGVSHIGGHKFAPNTIMYPSGDWHGNLSELDSNDAQQILFDALANGGIAGGVRERVADPIMIDKWRGRIGMNKQEQMKLYEQVLEKQKSRMVWPSPEKDTEPRGLFSAPDEELYEDDGLKEQVNAVSIESNKPSSSPAVSATTEEPKRVKIIFETFQKVRTEIDAKVGERILDIVKDKDPSRHGVYQALECTCGGQLECATCHVYIEPPFNARLTPVTDAEEDMLEYAVGRKEEVSRLGCQIKIQPELEGMVVKLPQY
ncbi:hypothetical protein BGZ95_000769 [Linnemannia exigua]|uniref:2Fe-2S ferredoxin-type domain-containing protein n=1 Tax=Linnemannia exigua TaxID=604196 RepID=A0AAD4D841_9FUNG|nr:hypothetical protein BGZ95_000769 [Linnemannia exigua]